MKISDAFLEDEVRDGFYIPSIIKRSWANDLTLLGIIDEICQKNDIQYGLDWGTLLGAVRHGGIIPWDDDIDVVMHRNELEKFLKICEKEYADEVKIITFENNDYHWKFIVNIATSDRMCFEPEYLRTHYNFPFISSIDIFVMDNVSDDEKQEQERCDKVNYLLNIDSGIENGDFTAAEIRKFSQIIDQKYGTKLFGLKDLVSIRKGIMLEALKELKRFNDNPTKIIAQMVPWGLQKKAYYPREYFENTIRVPFEELEVSIPIYADAMLQKKYGLFQKVVRAEFGHKYPYFESQLELLGTEEDIFPTYHFQKNTLEQAYDDSMSLKQIAREYVAHLQEVREQLALQISENPNFFADEQQMAIDFGTLVEQVKGEGTQTVHALEQYCEALFVLSQGDERAGLSDVGMVLAAIIEYTQDEIIQRKEVVFLSYKAKYWDVFAPIFDSLMTSDHQKVDIYIIPMPYGYKAYDRTVDTWIDESNEYPKNLVLTNYWDYDFSLHCPDEVYYQNPYDQYNLATSTVPELFISRIRPYARKMIYIPYLCIGDYKKEDTIAKYNMQYFILMPGVALADEIRLQTLEMKERYIEQLTDWAGEETRDFWCEKIVVQESPEQEERKPVEKKVFLYYCSVSMLLYYGDAYLNKMRDNLRVFGDNREKVSVILRLANHFHEELQKHDETLLQKWKELEQWIATLEYVIVDRQTEAEKLAKVSYAFYGDSSVFAAKMVYQKKPVMIQKIED